MSFQSGTYHHSSSLGDQLIRRGSVFYSVIQDFNFNDVLPTKSSLNFLKFQSGKSKGTSKLRKKSYFVTLFFVWLLVSSERRER